MISTLVTIAATLGAATAWAVVDPNVYSVLNNADSDLPLIVSFRGPRLQSILGEYASNFSMAQRNVDYEVLPRILEANSDAAQARALELLKSRVLANGETCAEDCYRRLWAFNKLVVYKPDAAIVAKLAALPEVERIEADIVFKAFDEEEGIEVEEESSDSETLQNRNEWGVENVGAPRVWAAGYDGEGVVVGVIDTGTRPEHEALEGNFRKDYGWYDPTAKKAAAYDDQGHGTHCTGTIAGTKGIGVAPKAKWIACKALARSNGRASYVLECGQFMYCPTDPEGKNKDCSKRAKVINNSYGSQGYTTYYNDMIDLWESAGMIGIFSNGNSGRNGCKTTGSPAQYEKAISVGAIDVNNRITDFSSRGPTEKDKMKPDISAPGANVRSAGTRSRTNYVSMSGTSMAGPHVAGVAALYAQKNPELTNEEVRQILVQGAKPLSGTKGETCGGTRDDKYPNNISGAGRIYAPTYFGQA